MILVTNVNSDASDDLLAAVKLLSRNHLVMVANIQETALKSNVNSDVDSMDDALRYCASIDSLQQRKKLVAQLKSHGVTAVESQASVVYQGLLNEYTALKRSGKF